MSNSDHHIQTILSRLKLYPYMVAVIAIGISLVTSLVYQTIAHVKLDAREIISSSNLRAINMDEILTIENKFLSFHDLSDEELQSKMEEAKIRFNEQIEEYAKNKHISIIDIKNKKLYGIKDISEDLYYKLSAKAMKNKEDIK